MKAKEAVDRLDPNKWSRTPPAERLHFLEQVRGNLKTYGNELAAADTRMKNGLMGETLFNDALSKVATMVPMANTVTAAIELYEELVHGEMPEPLAITKIDKGLYDINVFPSSAKDRLMYGDRTEVLRVTGEPKQIDPMDKPAGIVAVLGAGNYSSSLEMLKAMFFENCTVVHKPHHLNAATDAVWEKIMEPLVEHGVLSFVDHDQGRDLTVDPRLSKIYFTGGTSTALAIMKATDTPMVSECGGNNPCLIVPGERPWTDKEITHQAQQIATISKMNGGAVCGRVQTVVTSRNWPQREAFLVALRRAIAEDTPAAGTYYPGSDETAQAFREAYPNAEILEPEGGRFEHADFVLITNAEEQGYATAHEAFCQIIGEVPLDTEANADDFLPKAVAFCNAHLLGTLAGCILIDEDTKKVHQAALDQAVTDMEYGAIAINTMPPFIFLSPWLTWGGNEEGKEFVSGHGNFGNGMNFENVQKSIMTAGFMSPGHMIQTNKTAFDRMATNMARYAVEPNWMNLIRLMGGAVAGSLRHKDF